MKIFSLLLLLTLLLSCEAPDPGEGDLHSIFVMSHNIGYRNFPETNFIDNCNSYANYLINNYIDTDDQPDVIIFQEAFDSPGVFCLTDILLDELGSNWYMTDLLQAFNSTPFGQGHGIVILTKKNVISENHFEFEDCNGNSCCGFDCHANKGFVELEIDLGNSDKVILIGTHLDAGEAFLDNFARINQMGELEDRVNNIYNGYTRNIPIITSGDLNVRKNVFNEYGLIYSEMNHINLAEWAGYFENNATSNDGKVLDYVTFFNESEPLIDPTISLLLSPDCEVINLDYSDHCLMTARIAFRNGEKS